MRTKEERIIEARPIITKLAELKLTAESPPVKELYTNLQNYIQKGERININIPFASIGRNIKGVLATDTKEDVWIKLESM